ncbi:hypothetical protein [Chryseobacterium sp.]|uniref:hypothetical protein n=1 Tax=Chryseobacterium sp. TaxID=1871047 RepID=UPI002FC87603
MKNYLSLIPFLLLMSCANDDIIENVVSNTSSTKIQTLTIKDEEILNGVATLYEKLDFKFEYSNDKLIKVYDIHGNYTENLTYINNSLTSITISGYAYPQLVDHTPLDIKRNTTCNTNNQIILSENPVQNSLGNRFYTTFEYPSVDIIIAKDYIKSFNNSGILKKTSKIFLNNGNVTKIQSTYDGSDIFLKEIRYEYDQKNNPNFLIDRNRILALPEYAFNVFALQDYSQISKNNVLKRTEYLLPTNEQYSNVLNVNYNYENNDFPETIYLQYNYPDNQGLKVSAIYGY